MNPVVRNGRIRLLALPLALLLVLENVCVVPICHAQTQKVKVQMGTLMDLVFDPAVSGDTSALGQTVTLRVVNAVVVEGKTVIAAGAPAVGEVQSAKKRGMIGSAGSLVVAAKNTTAVDGTFVPLTGTKAIDGKSKVTSAVVVTILCCVLGLLMKGGKAEIPAGTSMRASVAAPVEVAAP